jgi:hypothetical protein
MEPGRRDVLAEPRQHLQRVERDSVLAGGRVDVAAAVGRPGPIGATRMALCTEKPESLQARSPAATSSSSRPRCRNIAITRRRNSSSATAAGGSGSGVNAPAPSTTPAVTKA